LTPIIGASFLGIERFTPPWDAIFLPLLNLLIGIYRLPFADLVVAIVVVTLIVRTIVAPLTARQLRSSKEIQRMAPLVSEVRRKHKGNNQKIYQETQALYREHGVNQFAGCLPAFAQLPILLILYQVLIRAAGLIQGFTVSDTNRAAFEALEQRNLVEALGNNSYRLAVDGPCDLDAYAQLPQFLPLNCQLLEGLKLQEHVNTAVSYLPGLDLAQVDTTLALPILGFYLSAIAVVAAILQFIQVKMVSPRPIADDPTSGITNTMTYTFPLMTIIWGAIFPVGLMIYWAATSLYSIVQQFLILGWGNLFPIFGWQPSWAPAPEPALVPAARPNRTEDADADAVSERPRSTPSRSPVPAGSRGNNPRPGSRSKGSAKRRGRKR
jgi:YidC/Oxa1 family membrane protein insertase